MQCPRCKGNEVETDHEPRPVIYSTKPEQAQYLRYTCDTCHYEWLIKSDDSAGEHLLK